MKDGCLFNGEPWFNGTIVDCKPPSMRGIVDIREKGGKYHRIPVDQIAFLGTFFREYEIVMVDNLEEAEAESKSNLQEGDNDLDEEAEDGVSIE